jgi:hypothetical protein
MYRGIERPISRVLPARPRLPINNADEFAKWSTRSGLRILIRLRLLGHQTEI